MNTQINLKLLVLTATVSFEEYYILKLENFDPKKLVNYQIDMYEIPLEKTQVESIKIIDKNNFWVTSEAETFGSPYLFKISLYWSIPSELIIEASTPSPEVPLIKPKTVNNLPIIIFF